MARTAARQKLPKAYRLLLLLLLKYVVFKLMVEVVSKEIVNMSVHRVVSVRAIANSSPRARTVSSPRTARRRTEGFGESVFDYMFDNRLHATLALSSCRQRERGLGPG